MRAPAYDPAKAWVSKKFAHDTMLWCCRFSPCGRFVAAGGIDCHVHLWELESDRKITLGCHDGWISALEFHSDSKRLFSVDLRGTIQCWAHAEKEPRVLWSRKGAHEGWTRTFALSPDGKTLATVGHDLAVRLWSAEDGKPLKELKGHKSHVYSVAFHPGGKALATGDVLGTVIHWDLASGKAARELDARVLHTRKDNFLADVGGARCLAFDPDGKRLVCGGMRDAKSNAFCPGKPIVVEFDWASGKKKAELVATGPMEGPFHALRFLPESILAGQGESHKGSGIAFWKPGETKPYHTVKGQSAYSIDLHPDGRRIAVAEFEAQGRGGNGRHVKRSEYTTNGGRIGIYSLHAK